MKRSKPSLANKLAEFERRLIATNAKQKIHEIMSWIDFYLQNDRACLADGRRLELIAAANLKRLRNGASLDDAEQDAIAAYARWVKDHGSYFLAKAAELQSMVVAARDAYARAQGIVSEARALGLPFLSALPPMPILPI